MEMLQVERKLSQLLTQIQKKTVSDINIPFLTMGMARLKQIIVKTQAITTLQKKYTQ